jgi:hypothetical protein
MRIVAVQMLMEDIIVVRHPKIKAYVRDTTTIIRDTTTIILEQKTIAIRMKVGMSTSMSLM